MYVPAIKIVTVLHYVQHCVFKYCHHLIIKSCIVDHFDNSRKGEKFPM